jgi:hypothetical protein
LEVKGDFCGKVQAILARHGRAGDYVEIGLSPNAPSPTATIPKKSYSRLPGAARVTKATLSITHGSGSRRHKLSYNDKTMLNNLVRISERDSSA